MRFEVVQHIFLAGMLSGIGLGILLGRLFPKKEKETIKIIEKHYSDEQDVCGVVVE